MSTSKLIISRTLKTAFSQLTDLRETMLSRWKLLTDRSVSAAIHSWCARELAPWNRDRRITVSDEALHALNATRPWTFLFSVGPHGVVALPKPANSDTAGEPATRRVKMYESFLDRVVRKARLSASFTIAIDVNDQPISSEDVPIFTFQKPVGSKHILIPDIDFLLETHSSLPCWSTFDRVSWRHKKNSAVFAGSTTGGPITEQVVHDLSLPRLRSGMFFRDKAEVEFRLPYLVECDTPDTERMLRNLGFGVQPIPWGRQFHHRFIISMDGHGATCSRVAIALRSQSVLLKYASDHQLYYFYGLTPWQQYVPVNVDQEVIDIIKLAHRDSQPFQEISNAGRKFARTYLTRHSVEYYMTTLMRRYSTIIAHQPAESPARTKFNVG